jgi:hypothetical protein
VAVKEVPVGRGRVVAFGHYGGPCSPSRPSAARRGSGTTGDGRRGRRLLAEGRLKLYCVDAWDAGTWSDESIPTDERARRHDAFEGWVHDELLPWIAPTAAARPRSSPPACRSGLPRRPARPAPRRPLPLAIGPERQLRARGLARLGRRPVLPLPAALRPGPGRRPPRVAAGAAVRPAGLRAGDVGGHHGLAGLDPRARRRTAGAGPAVRARPLGHDVPHDWPSWRAQIAHHLPRFC